MAALVPRPRPQLVGFFGGLAPNAKLRSPAVRQGPLEQREPAAEFEVKTVEVRPQRIGWARLLKRVFGIDIHTCPTCDAGELKISAAILERSVID